MQPNHILIADDDDSWRWMMGAYLRQQGYEVEEAADGQTALTALQTRALFDILVTDLNMPGLNGLELMHAARQMPSPPEVIVVTAAATLEPAITALREGGIADYLRKPLKQLGDLLMAVSRAVACRRMRLEQEMFQNQLALEAERLRTLVAYTEDAILAADAGGVLRVVNPAARRLLARDNLEGEEAQASLPSPLATLLANWLAAGGQYPLVVEVPWPVGALQTVSLAPMAEGEAAHGWVMVVRDITHLKRQETLKLRLLQETAHRVQFPLARAIFTLTELKEVVEERGTSATEAYYRLVKLWGRIQEWVDSLMNLVRLESGVGFQLMAVDLAPVLDEVQQGLTTGLFAEKQLKFVMNRLPLLPLVRADPQLLRQLLHSLLQRAALRSTIGGAVGFTVSEQYGHVWLEISDAGPPLTEADWPYTYEKSLGYAPFDLERLGGELALAHSIIDQMGGQIWIGRPGGPGSTLTLCLLAIVRAETEAGAPPASSANP